MQWESVFCMSSTVYIKYTLTEYIQKSRTKGPFGSFEPSLLFYCTLFLHYNWNRKYRIALPSHSVTDSLLLFLAKMNQFCARGNRTLSVLYINKTLILMANPKLTSHPNFRTRGRFCGKSKGISKLLHLSSQYC